jgi:hypothetical protein
MFRPEAMKTGGIRRCFITMRQIAAKQYTLRVRILSPHFELTDAASTPGPEFELFS